MNSNIPKIVSSLIKKYNTRDPYSLAQYLNIEIIESRTRSVKYSMAKFMG